MEPPRDSERLWPEMTWPSTRKSVQRVYFDRAGRTVWITHYTSHDDQVQHWPTSTERATLPDVPTLEGWFAAHPAAVTSSVLTQAVDVASDPLGVAESAIPYGALPLAARALAEALESECESSTIRRHAKRAAVAAFVLLAAAEEFGPRTGIEPIAGMPWLSQPNDISLQTGPQWQDRFVREHRAALREWMLTLEDADVDAMFQPFIPSDPPDADVLRGLLASPERVGRFCTAGRGAPFAAVAPIATVWLRSENPWAWVHGFTLLGCSDADFDALRAEREAQEARRERERRARPPPAPARAWWERILGIVMDRSQELMFLLGILFALGWVWVIVNLLG